MGTEKRNRNWKESTERIIVRLIFMIFSVMFLVFMFWGMITPEYNPIILNTSIGLLTFVAIFYFSVVLRREIKERREDFLSKKWKEEYRDEISEHLDKMSEEKDKPYPDSSTLRDAFYKASAIPEDFSQVKERTDITKFLNWCVIYFILAIIFVVIDYGAKFEIHSKGVPVTGTWVGFMAMWVGIYYLARLIMAWIIISEYEP